MPVSFFFWNNEKLVLISLLLYCCCSFDFVLLGFRFSFEFLIPRGSFLVASVISYQLLPLSLSVRGPVYWLMWSFLVSVFLSFDYFLFFHMLVLFPVCVLRTPWLFSPVDFFTFVLLPQFLVCNKSSVHKINSWVHCCQCQIIYYVSLHAAFAAPCNRLFSLLLVEFWVFWISFLLFLLLSGFFLFFYFFYSSSH